MNKTYKKAIIYARVSSDKQLVGYKPNYLDDKIKSVQNHNNIIKNTDPSDKARRKMVARAARIDKVVDRVIRKEPQRVIFRKMQRNTK